jgi:hypothetical protein
MSSLISSSHIIQVDMLRMCFGLMLIGLAVAAHTVWAREGSFASDLDILAIQPVRSNAGGLYSYQLNAEVVLAHSQGVAPAGSMFSNMPQLHIVAEPKQEAVWPISARWHITPESERFSLSPVLRFESKGERIEIKPRLNSIWFVWQKALP